MVLHSFQISTSPDLTIHPPALHRQLPLDQRQGVPHHLIDVRDVDEEFSAVRESQLVVALDRVVTLDRVFTLDRVVTLDLVGIFEGCKGLLLGRSLD